MSYDLHSISCAFETLSNKLSLLELVICWSETHNIFFLFQSRCKAILVESVWSSVTCDGWLVGIVVREGASGTLAEAPGVSLVMVSGLK